MVIASHHDTCIDSSSDMASQKIIETNSSGAIEKRIASFNGGEIRCGDDVKCHVIPFSCLGVGEVKDFPSNVSVSGVNVHQACPVPAVNAHSVTDDL